MKTRLKEHVSLSLAACFVTSTVLAAGFQDDPGKHLDVLEDGKPIVRYMYGYDRSSGDRKHETYKVYHHVMNADGTDTITKGPRGQFTHHRGIFIGWSKLRHDDGQHDLWHMKQGAVQKHKEFLVKKSGSSESVLSTRIDWFDSDGKTVCLEETRTVRVHHNKPKAFTVIDFKSELEAVNGDVELRGDPEHAGMQYRPAQDVAKNKSAVYTFHKEDINPKTDRDLPWVAMTYNMENGDTYTVQHMNHPDNPKDTLYSAYRDYGRFGAFFETNIKDSETLTLRYRIQIYKGEAPSREEMGQQYKKYVSSSSPAA